MKYSYKDQQKVQFNLYNKITIMTNLQSASSLTLNYTLHPLLQQLNRQLVKEKPYNPVKFIKIWATKKLKEMYLIDEDQSEEEELQYQQNRKLEKRLNEANFDSPLIRQPKKQKQPKRRNAIIFTSKQPCQLPSQIQGLKLKPSNRQDHKQSISERNQIPKSQQAKSRVMISLKNDIFFKSLSWDQMAEFVQKGIIFQTVNQNFVLQKVGTPILEFAIVLSGVVVRQSQINTTKRTFESGQCVLHDSFLHTLPSAYSYFCPEPKTVLFILPGQLIHQALKSFYYEKYLIFQKGLMNKVQFNYLDNDQKDKLINCFKQVRQIMENQVVLKPQKATQQKNKYLYIVLKGQFSKCKLNLSGELTAFKTLSQGDFFGEQVLYKGVQLDYSVVCVEDNSEIGYVDKQSLQQSIGSFDRISRRGMMQIKYNNF